VVLNRQYVSDANQIQHKAPELLDKVLDGSLSLPDAKKLANMPEEDRDKK
jgi:hypothetical protein